MNPNTYEVFEGHKAILNEFNAGRQLISVPQSIAQGDLQTRADYVETVRARPGGLNRAQRRARQRAERMAVKRG